MIITQKSSDNLLLFGSEGFGMMLFTPPPIAQLADSQQFNATIDLFLTARRLSAPHRVGPERALHYVAYVCAYMKKVSEDVTTPAGLTFGTYLYENN